MVYAFHTQICGFPLQQSKHFTRKTLNGTAIHQITINHGNSAVVKSKCFLCEDFFFFLLFFSFNLMHHIIGIKHGFNCINIGKVLREVLKTEALGQFSTPPEGPSEC